MKKKQETIITDLIIIFMMSAILSFISTSFIEDRTLMEFVRQYLITTFLWFFFIVITVVVGVGLLTLIKHLKKKLK